MPVIAEKVSFVHFAIGPYVLPETMFPVISETSFEKMSFSVDLFPLPFKELILYLTDMLGAQSSPVQSHRLFHISKLALRYVHYLRHLPQELIKLSDTVTDSEELSQLKHQPFREVC